MRKSNPFSTILAGFASVIAVGTILLVLPISTTDGKGLPFLDAVFTATSATCVTGLTTISVQETL
ncbi:MAG: Trk family potassium uptake protein, partial [bacterium]